MTTQTLRGELGAKHAAALILAGECVVLPTETVYGLAANALNANACRRVFQIKNRPADNPLIVHVASVAQACEVAALNEQAKLLFSEFAPGPLTLVLPKKNCLPREVTAGLSTIALRIPSHKLFRLVIDLSRVPLAAPSANLSGRPSPTRVSHALRDLSGLVPAVLDGGECSVGVESTIIDLSGDAPALLRPGHITPADILRKTGIAVFVPPEHDDTSPKAPGMKYRHYAPNANVVVLRGDSGACSDYVFAEGGAAGVICASDGKALFNGAAVVTVGGGSCAEWEHTLFSALRELDDLGVDSIYCVNPRGEAVNNRLAKASGGKEVCVCTK